MDVCSKVARLGKSTVVNFRHNSKVKVNSSSYKFKFHSFTLVVLISYQLNEIFHIFKYTFFVFSKSLSSKLCGK